MDPDDGRMLPNFITQGLAGEPLTVYGDGSFTRSLCYVDDLVGGLLAVMESSRVDAVGRVYNLGNPDERTVQEFAQRVLELIPESPSTLRFLPPVPDDPTRRQPDISRVRTELGWEPRVPLSHGLAATVAWFRDAVNAAPPDQVLTRQTPQPAP
jgi:nucleoside-diphosphate-sugar epimerase